MSVETDIAEDLREEGWSPADIRSALEEIRTAYTHSLAENFRRETEEGYRRVKDAYGWSYANGWRSGRNRLADRIDPEVER